MIPGLAGDPCGRCRWPRATKYVIPSSTTSSISGSVHTSASAVATASLYPSDLKTPLTRGSDTVGKKSLRSRFTSTSAPTCGRALLTIDRPTRNPCAASCSPTLSSTFSSTHRCAFFNLGIGAEIRRCPPVFFGSKKRR